MTFLEFHRGQKYQFEIDIHSCSSNGMAKLSEEFLYNGDELWDDDFYEGRCYQFLLDKEIEIPAGHYSLVKKAETRWHDMLMAEYEEEGTVYYIKCCDYCSEWKYDHRRCSCGNRRMMLTCDSDRCHLDESDIRVRPEPY